MKALSQDNVLRIERSFYVVTELSYSRTDYRRKCWLCGKGFEISDNISVIFYVRGPSRLAHDQCVEAADAL